MLSFHRSRLVLFAAVLAALIAEPASAVCAEASPPPKHSDKRPVVFLPGVIGSVLENDKGVVWGDRWSLARLPELEIPDGPIDPTDGIHPTRIVDSIQVLGPFSVGQYSSIRELFVEKLGYELGVNYFEYPYDWRQSNFTSAKCFQKWVDASLPNREFDLIGHSMGGIISEIFIKQHPGGKQVRRFMTLGTPYLGSVDIIAMVEEGWGWYANWMSGGMPKIRRIMLSFPSFYELLPSYQFCCSLVDEDGTRRELQLRTKQGWDRLAWEIATGNSRPDKRVTHALAEGERLKALILEDIQNHIAAKDLFRVASREIKTKGRFRVSATTGKIREFNHFLGDGTVIFRSATKCTNNSDKSCGSRSDISFAKHGKIFDDPAAIERFVRVFGPGTPGPTEYGSSETSFVTTDQRLLTMKSVSMEMEPRILKPGQPFKITLELESAPGAPVERVPVSGELSSDLGSTVSLAFDTPSVQNAAESRTARFNAKGIAPAVAGGFSTRVSVLTTRRGVSGPLVLEELAMVFGVPPVKATQKDSQ